MLGNDDGPGGQLSDLMPPGEGHAAGREGALAGGTDGRAMLDDTIDLPDGKQRPPEALMTRLTAGAFAGGLLRVVTRGERIGGGGLGRVGRVGVKAVFEILDALIELAVKVTERLTTQAPGRPYLLFDWALICHTPQLSVLQQDLLEDVNGY